MKAKPQWADEEIATMLHLRNSGASWEQISKKLANRTADAVRNEYHRRSREAGTYLPAAQPDSTPVVYESSRNRTTWTAQDDHTLMSALRRYGHIHSVVGAPWRKIGSLLPNRTDSSVRNRANRLLQGLKSKISPVSISPPTVDEQFSSSSHDADAAVAPSLAPPLPLFASDAAAEQSLDSAFDFLANTDPMMMRLRVPHDLSYRSAAASPVSTPNVSSHASSFGGDDDDDERARCELLSQICHPSWSFDSSCSTTRDSGTSSARDSGRASARNTAVERRPSAADRASRVSSVSSSRRDSGDATATRRRETPAVFVDDRCSRDSCRDSDQVSDLEFGLEEVSWSLRQLGLLAEADEEDSANFSLDELTHIATSLKEESDRHKLALAAEGPPAVAHQPSLIETGQPVD